MAYNYPLNNPGGVHLTVFNFTHLSPPPNKGQFSTFDASLFYDVHSYIFFFRKNTENKNTKLNILCFFCTASTKIYVWYATDMFFFSSQSQLKGNAGECVKYEKTQDNATCGKHTDLYLVCIDDKIQMLHKIDDTVSPLP